MLAGALWGAIPGLVKAFLNINEVLACIMTNWIAANLVTWMFDISQFQESSWRTPSPAISIRPASTAWPPPSWGWTPVPRLPGQWRHSDCHRHRHRHVHPDEQDHPGLRAEGLRRQPPRRPVRRHPDKRNIVLSMAIAGALAGAGRVPVLPVRQHGVLSGPPIRPCPPWASTASPWPCWP